ncbi:N-hydroxyarylamine O-acetyltransferase [Natronoarchaeum philippinense]|uniref:N-hydroxyarylamine O-acetyltransferase n=1 Tax=Natronoarchaeum philippinense TaxID=558529 RepID=A0A285N0Y2_NATPI|nr:arylamine N-acetyltransferase [Natronoarchaeum philippinense]SNZ03102.1 N-hydroxyarylamine O-acetyltransferase [Natronoarchaeum philippinense]
METDRYLRRIGVDPTTVERADRETLDRLQRAHVTTVPFETIAVAGTPFGEHDPSGVSRAYQDLYEKIVEDGRGGFCYELNGLFGWLLSELGYEPTRVAAMVLGDDDPLPPANHLAHVVDLDRRYLVDAGLGVPSMRRPLPLDGEARTDAAGVDWRVVESDRPDADFETLCREPTEGWETRYVFRDTHRPREHFTATCEYLSTAPESPFTDDAVVACSTDRGHVKLSPDSLTRVRDGDERERDIDADEWSELLGAEFGITLGT